MFVWVVIGGVGFGALIKYVVSCAPPSMVSALCGIIAIGWYLASRAVSGRLSKRDELQVELANDVRL